MAAVPVCGIPVKTRETGVRCTPQVLGQCGLSSVGSSVPARHAAAGGRGRLTGACLIRGPWWLAPPWGPPREHPSASACSRGDREGGGTQV